MAAKVNTKFVVILAAALFSVFVAVALLATYAHLRSGERVIKQGHAFAAQGDWEGAAKKYSRGVARDQTNVEWLELWRDALLKTTPDTPLAYGDAYNKDYLSVLRQLALVLSTDPQRQIDAIDEFDRRIRFSPGGGSVAAFQSLVTQVDEAAERLDPNDPGTKRLLGYRGRAVVEEMLRLPTIEDDRRQRAMADLQGAVEADPSDYKSALGIIRWHEAEIMRQRDRGRDAVADQNEQELRALIDDVASRFPDVIEVRIYVFRAGMRDLFADATTPEIAAGLQGEANERAATLLAEIAAFPDERITSDATQSVVANLSGLMSGEEGQDAMLAFIDRSLAINDNDPFILAGKARFLSSARRFDDTLAVYQQIIDLPDLPVSLEGYLLPSLRRMANALQIDVLLEQRAGAEDEAERADLLARAKAKREDLVGRTDVNFESELKLRDAKIAIVEGDLANAAALLDQLRAVQPENTAVLTLLARTLTDLGHFGEARNTYESLISLGAGDYGTYVRLADIELQLQDIDRARAHYEAALRLNPEGEYPTRRLAVLDQASGELEAGQTLDPIIAALMAFREARNEGDTGRARSIIEKVREEHPGDVRLIEQHVAIEIASGERERAKEIVAAALAEKPDNRALRRLAQYTEHEDPIEAAIAIVDDTDASELDKAIARHNVYMQAGRFDRAAEMFEQAESIDPDSPIVIELGFKRALAEGGVEALTRAARYAERAAEKNVDQRGGLTFKGRLELARGETREAEASFLRAVEMLSFDPSGWRWLAQAQRANGKVDVALESFKRAYEADPQSVPIAAEYAAALLAAGQGARALEVVGPETGVLRYGADHPSVVDLWLKLEAQYGDAESALDTRRKRFKRNPDDLVNASSLVSVLIAEEGWEEGEEVIDTIARGEASDPLDVVVLRARLLAAQERIDEARAVMVAYVEGLAEEDRSVRTFLALGAFEREHGSPEDAIAAFEGAIAYQDSALREADRSLGDLLFVLGEGALRAASSARRQGTAEEAVAATELAREYFFRAAQHYRTVAEASPTQDIVVIKRLAETQVRLGQNEEALALLTSIGNDDDLQALLLKAVVAQSRDDRRAAREHLDRAVELYPSDPTPFYRRAMLNQSEPALIPDVLQDLDTATKLNPSFIDAWALSFAVNSRMGELDKAFAQVRSAIRSNPDNLQLKRLLVDLLRRNGRTTEAQAFAVSVADDLVDNREWLHTAALLSYDQRAYNEAERLFKRIYELEPDPLSAADLLNALLRRSAKPTRAEVNRLLPIVQESDRRTPGMLMLQARAHEFLEEPGPAETLTLEAYEEARKTPDGASLMIKLWFDNLQLRFDRDLDRSFAYLRETDELGTLPPILRVTLVARDNVMNVDPKECLAALEEIEPETEGDLFSIIELLKVRNQLHYKLGNYDECLTACLRGLEIAPNDLELNNNLAYTLAKHLEDPERALPYAEVAASLAPLNPAVLDTLGWVYFENGRFRDADRVLSRSLATSNTPDDFVPAYLHLALSKNAIGDQREARRLIILAKESVVEASAPIREQYEGEILALFEELK